MDILCELADVMELEDPLLRRGYEAIVRNAITRIGLTFSDLKASDAPMRIPTRFHSRFNGVKSANLFRPVPAAEIHPDDAAKLGIRHGEQIALSTETGTIHVSAHLTRSVVWAVEHASWPASTKIRFFKKGIDSDVA